MRCVKLKQSHFICLFILNTFLVYSMMYNPVPVQRSRVVGNGTSKVRFVTYDTLSSWIDPIITSKVFILRLQHYFIFYDILLRY